MDARDNPRQVNDDQRPATAPILDIHQMYDVRSQVRVKQGHDLSFSVRYGVSTSNLNNTQGRHKGNPQSTPPHKLMLTSDFEGPPPTPKTPSTLTS